MSLVKGDLVSVKRDKVSVKRDQYVSHRGSSSSDMLDIGVTAKHALTCRQIMSRHYTGVTQNALRIASTPGGGDAPLPHTLSYSHPNLRDRPPVD